jgi:hypothetical protein
MYSGYGGYSSFAHIASGLFVKSGTLMLIVRPDSLSLYCDASGNEREPLTVVGSALATLDDWLEFEPKWKAVLSKYGVEEFHAVDFASCTEEFKNGWRDQDRRNAFSWDLLSVLSVTIKRWFGLAILQREYEKADRIYEVHENFQPFAIASEGCIQAALDWRVAHHLDYLPLKYFFESGDSHWGQMSDRIKERFGEAPIPGTKKDAPLQAADFVAYELRKAHMELQVEDKKLWTKFRKSFLLLGQIEGTFGQVSETNIRTTMSLRGVSKRVR